MTRTINREELFDLSFNYSTKGIAIVDINGNYIEVNKALCDISGYSEEEFLSNKIIHTKENTLTEEKRLLTPLINNEVPSVQYNIDRSSRSGETRKLSINAIAIHQNGKENKPTHILKHVEGVAEVEDLKRIIKQKQFVINKVLNELPANIYFKDLDSKFTLVNNSMAKHFKVDSPKDLIGKSDFDFFPSELAKEKYDTEQKIIKTREGIKKTEKNIFDNGKTTWVHSSKKCLFNEKNEVIGTFGVSKDITESKQSELDLANAHKDISRKNKELQVTLESLKEAQSSLVNSEKLAALGQLIAGIAHEINTPLGAINASNSNISHSFSQLVANKITPLKEHETVLLKQLISNFNKDEAALLTSREKREIKKKVAEKFISEGNPDAKKIADIIVYINQHEHLDMITDFAKKGNVLNILETTKIIISILKNSQNINIAITKASNVVLALKKYIHRTPDGQKYDTDIIDNIETVLTLNQNTLKQGVTVVKNYDKLPLIKLYQDEISQVWNNLITNAIHAMCNKGTLTIDVINNTDNVMVKFTDTGCGIPEDIRKDIFTPFFTTKVSGEGTGLGLDIIKRIVEKHSGSISFDTELNVGTSFSITLPVNC